MPLRCIADIFDFELQTIYDRIDFLYRQCKTFVAARERKLQNSLDFKQLYLSVDRQIYLVNWWHTETKKNVPIYATGCADNDSKYVFAMESNYDPEMKWNEIEEKANLLDDYSRTNVFRRFARLWLREDFQKESLINELSDKTVYDFISTGKHGDVDKDNIAYFQGATRAPRIIEQFCEQNILPMLDPLAVRELYIDSEYTKEKDFHYYKKVTFKNGDIFICLRKNKQIIKLIQPALDDNQGWQRYNQEDEFKAIKVNLPKTGLAMKIVILRDRDKKEKNIRCFGTTNVQLAAKDILRKYRFRWIIENGIKDLVASYFIDEVFGLDPAKVEFEFYCVMVARLAYEYFLKELAGKYYNKVDGNKYTLQKMRNILFEKRNCTIEQDHSGNLMLTLLDWQHKGTTEDHVAKMLLSLSQKGKNKVLWWNNRGIFLRAKNQYEMLKSVQ